MNSKFDYSFKNIITNKNFISIILCFSITVTGLTVFFESYPSKTIAGYTFEQALLNSGVKEINFRFNKQMIRFSSYEESSQMWEDLLNLSFEPPISGSIRTISGDSFSYVFDTSVPKDTEISVFFNTNLIALDKTSALLDIEYQKASQSPFVIKAELPYISHATRLDNDLKSPIYLSASMPISLKQLKQKLSITYNNKKIPYNINYDIQTNRSFIAIDVIETNYLYIVVYPLNLQKDTEYLLFVEQQDPNSYPDISDFEYSFTTYGLPKWEGLSSMGYRPPIPRYSNIYRNDSPVEEPLSFTVGDDLWLSSSNPLKIYSNTNSLITINPKVSNLSYCLDENGIKINGDFQGGTEYSLVFTPQDIVDTHGQTLEETYTNNFVLNHKKPVLQQVQRLLILDSNNPAIPFQTVNVTNVQISYQQVNSSYYTAISLYGRVLPLITYKTNIILSNKVDQVSWNTLDVSKLFTNQTMLLLVNLQDKDNPTTNNKFTKVLKIKNALTAHISTTDMLFHARDIKTQMPIENMMISIWDPVRNSFQDLGTTTTEGTLRVPNPKLPLKSLEKPVFIGMLRENDLDQITFVTGEDSYFYGIDDSFFNSSSQLIYNNITQSQKERSVVLTDRFLYEAGETVYIHAIARSRTNDQFSSSTPFFNQAVRICIKDPSYKTVTNFTQRWSDFGSLDFAFKSLSNSMRGTYTVIIQNKSSDFIDNTYFRIQAISPKKGEILINSSSNQYLFGESLEVTLKPQFFFQKELNTPLKYLISASPTRYTNISYPLHVFGVQDIPTPFMDLSRYPIVNNIVVSKGYFRSKENSFIKKKLVPKSYDNWQLTVFAQTDLETILPIKATNRNIYVYHPIQLGIYTKKYTVTNKETVKFNIVAIDMATQKLAENKLITFQISKATPVKLGVFSFLTNYLPKLNSYEKIIMNKSFSLGQQDVSFTPQGEGFYTVQISSLQQGVKVISKIHVTVLGKDSKNDDTRLIMESDKSIYNSGNSALIYISNPYPKARLFLTVERDFIKNFYTINTTNSIIEYPIVLTQDDEPGITVTAVLTAISNTNNIFPMQYGSINLLLNPIHKTLDIQISTSKPNYLPGEKITLTLSAKLQEQQINGQALLIIRDKSILSEEDKCLPNPLTNFYNNRFGSFTTWDSSKSFIEQQKITNTWSDSSVPTNPLMRNRGAKIMAFNSISSEDTATDSSTRSNILNTIYYKGDIKLFDNKDSIVSFDLPDNVSGFDVTVIAYDKDELFGKTNTNFTTSKPLLIDPQVPKFIRPNDKVIWGALLYNFTSQDIAGNATLINPFDKFVTNVTILSESNIFISQTTTISSNTNNNSWAMQIKSPLYEDSIIKRVPLIVDNPFVTSSYSGILSNSTNLVITPASTKDDFPQKLNLSVSPMPTVRIRSSLEQIITNESLYIMHITSRLLILLEHEQTIFNNKLSSLSRVELTTQIQKDLDSLKFYTLSNNSIATLPTGKFMSQDPMILLSVYHSLILGQLNTYFVDKELLDRLSDIVESYNQKENITPTAKAYALKLLVLHDLLDFENFKVSYSKLPSTLEVNALVLDTMYILGFPLDIISKQTSKVISEISETGNTITISNSSSIVANTLVRYYGTIKEGFKVVNGLDFNNNDVVPVFLSFAQKYPNTVMDSLVVTINNKKYQINQTNNQVSVELANKTSENITITLQSSSDSFLFYYIAYSYVTDDPSRFLNAGYSISTSYFNLEGKRIENNQLTFGEYYIVEHQVQASTAGPQQIAMTVPLYGGIIIASPEEQKQYLALDTYYYQDDKISLFTLLPNRNPYKIRYLIKATVKGSWTAPPISINKLESYEVFSYKAQDTLVIQ